MRRRDWWLVVSIAGVGMALVASLGGFLVLIASLIGRETGASASVETLTPAAIIAAGVGLGVPLALQGWAGWRGRTSSPFNPSGVGWLWIALVLLVGLGTVVVSLPLAPVWLLPPIHVLVMSIPSAVVLVSVGRALGGRGGTWREVVVGAFSGGTFGVGISLISEGLLALFGVLVVVVVLTVAPGGTEKVTALMERLRDPAWLTNPTNLLELLLSPAVAISALGFSAIPVPLIEEAFKTLGVGVAARWVRPTRERAFLWGVASGAGFALVENLFNGALGGAEGWAPVTIARFGATVMHCFTSGLTGWGWGEFWRERRISRLLGSYAVAVILHGFWNAAAVGTVLLSASALMHEGNDLWTAMTGIATLMLLGALGMLALTLLIALPGLARMLKSRSKTTSCFGD